MHIATTCQLQPLASQLQPLDFIDCNTSEPAISAKTTSFRVYTTMLRIGVWTLLCVYKQVVMNMSMARDPRGDEVNTTPPHVIVEMGMHMVCMFLNKMTI
jgi:hypothetical protein